MSAALKCNGIGCDVVIVDPEQAARWWRLERNGPSIEELVLPGQIPHLMPMMPVLSTEVEVNVGMDDDGQYVEEPVEEPDELVEEDLDPVVMHFCSDVFLAGWSAWSLAMSLDLPPDTGCV